MAPKIWAESKAVPTGPRPGESKCRNKLSRNTWGTWGTQAAPCKQRQEEAENSPCGVKEQTPTQREVDRRAAPAARSQVKAQSCPATHSLPHRLVFKQLFHARSCAQGFRGMLGRIQATHPPSQGPHSEPNGRVMEQPNAGQTDLTGESGSLFTRGIGVDFLDEQLMAAASRAPGLGGSTEH